MKIYENTIVYVQCVGSFATGGPELLHQFASYLVSRGVKTYMIYTGVDITKENPVCECYKHYNIPYTDSIVNNERNIIVVSETATNIACFSWLKVRKVIWWLSVDNFFHSIAYNYSITESNALKIRYEKYYSFEPDFQVEHWAQSEYARQFLIFNGIPDNSIKMVSDYLNLIFLDSLVAKRANVQEKSKENIVLYNPKKGLEFTNKLISYAPDIKWIPIINMTKDEVVDLLGIAKIYIDFGNHPGKDRLPREAAVSGAVVITNKRGSARNEMDVPIPSTYKFDDTEESIPEIIEKIKYVFNEYDECIKHFQSYVDSIFREPLKFRNEVDAALDFSLVNMKPTICLFDISYENILKLKAKIRNSNSHRLQYVINNVFKETDMSLEKELCCIDTSCARQLYLEGRINKFICSDSITDNQQSFFDLIKAIGIDDEDWDILSLRSDISKKCPNDSV